MILRDCQISLIVSMLPRYRLSRSSFGESSFNVRQDDSPGRRMNRQCRHEGTTMTLPEDGEIDEKQPRKGCGR